MWFKLATADFSSKNLGTMSSISSSYSISYTLGNGLTLLNAIGSVPNDNTQKPTLTFTLNTASYELGTVTVTMGTSTLVKDTNYTVSISGTTVTITFKTAITNSVSISIATTVINGDESDTPVNPTPGGAPTATTWYVKAAHTGLATLIDSANNSNGWVYYDTTEQAAIRNKPINALQIATTSTSGTVYVAIADSKGASSVHDLTKGTFTKTGTTKEVVTVLLEKTLTLTDNQYLVFEPAGVAPSRNYNLYYGTPSGSKAGFISRVPTDTSGTSTAWKDNSTNTIGISTGYYVEGTSETPSEVWYVDKASTSYPTEVKLDNKTYGWAYGGASEQAAIRNKPINAVKFATTSTSGTVTIGVAKGVAVDATISDIYNIQSATFTKSGTAKELVTVVFDNTFTLADDEYLIFEPSNEIDGLDYNHYYTGTGGAGFYSRIPQDVSGQNKGVSLFGTHDIGYATGYVPQ